MNKAEQFIENRLKQRADSGILRTLSAQPLPVDFSSNDYLGFARSEELKILITNTLRAIPDYKNGATGSRLTSPFSS